MTRRKWEVQKLILAYGCGLVGGPAPGHYLAVVARTIVALWVTSMHHCVFVREIGYSEDTL
jgi:hypothetical protein